MALGMVNVLLAIVAVVTVAAAPAGA